MPDEEAAGAERTRPRLTEIEQQSHQCPAELKRNCSGQRTEDRAAAMSTEHGPEQAGWSAELAVPWPTLRSLVCPETGEPTACSICFQLLSSCCREALNATHPAADLGSMPP